MCNSARSRVKCVFHSRVGAGVWLILCYAWTCRIFFLQVSYLRSRFSKIYLIKMGRNGEGLRSITSVILI